jgi:uncharacterized protein YigA (DUF484 family)
MSPTSHERLAEQISEKTVADYLSHHPEFFQHHTELLKSLYIPHPSGEAISLVSRQLEILRDENRMLRKKYTDMLDIGRNNDALLRKMHQLVLSLMEAESLQTAFSGLTDQLQNNFSSDFVAMHIIVDDEADWSAPNREMKQLAVSVDNDALIHFAEIMKSKQPLCGKATTEQLRFLFPTDYKDVASCAIIPIQHAGFAALMSIGSRDENRFDDNAGILFLAQMAELVGLRFAGLMETKALEEAESDHDLLSQISEQEFLQEHVGEPEQPENSTPEQATDADNKDDDSQE